MGRESGARTGEAISLGEDDKGELSGEDLGVSVRESKGKMAEEGEVGQVGEGEVRSGVVGIQAALVMMKS